MKLEINRPVVWPSRAEDKFFVGGLEQHGLQRERSGPAVIEIGRPVVAVPPEGGEALSAIVGPDEIGSHVGAGGTAKAEECGVDALLRPTGTVEFKTVGVGA